MMMPVPRFTGLFAFVLFAFLQAAGGADYYTRLSGSVELQNHGPQAIHDRTLIDDSNPGQKLKYVTLSFKKLAATGEVGPLQLGMTMDQVVAVLGLPPEAWWNHLGESRFDYPGWVLHFQSNTLHRVRITSPALRQLRTDPPMPRSSGTNTWISVLGTPSEQCDKRDIHAVHLVYHTNYANVTLAYRWWDSPLFQMIIERSATPTNVALPKIKLNKEHALILACLALRDSGWPLDDYQPPKLADENAQLNRRYGWTAYFEHKVPSPGSSVYVFIDQITGSPRIML